VALEKSKEPNIDLDLTLADYGDQLASDNDKRGRSFEADVLRGLAGELRRIVNQESEKDSSDEESA
jgi:hypothetical protein